MQTDELRAELTELANEVAPFTGDLPAIRHRVARRRMATASVAIVVAAVVGVGAIAITRSDPKQVTVANSVKKVELTQLPRFDVAVIAPAHATAQDVAHVEQIIADSNAVLRYAPVKLRNLAFLFPGGTDDAALNEMRARVCVSPSTPSFAIELSRREGAEQELRDAVGDDATVQMTQTNGRSDLELFMQVHAGQPEVDKVRAHLAADPDVASFTFLSHADAYEEFKRLFGNQRELVESESPASLPESFRITVRDEAKLSDVADRLDGLAGIDQINSPLRESAAPVPDYLLQLVCGSTTQP